MAHVAKTHRPPEAPAPRRRRWPARLLLVIALLALVFYGAGGWYFATVLESDALAVEPHERAYQATLTAVGTDTVTITQGDPGDGDLFNPGLLGIFWEDGYGTVAEVVEATDSTVTRRFTPVAGDPQPGDRVDVDPWVYPDDGGPELDLTLEQVEYQSALGPMDAVFVPGASDTWAILVHGKNATPREAYRLAAILAGGGLPVLAITHRNDRDQPADSSGYHQFGLAEWEDLEGAVRHALDAGASEVILGGLSTGGAVVLSFLERSELAAAAAGVILDSPNVDLGAAIDHSARGRTLPLVGLPVPSSLVWTAKTLSSWRFGVDWGELDYVSRAGETLEVPVLAIHGTADPSVPVEVSRRLAAASPDLVTLAEFDGGLHVQSWNLDPARYRQEVESFLSDL